MKSDVNLEAFKLFHMRRCVCTRSKRGASSGYPIAVQPFHMVLYSSKITLLMMPLDLELEQLCTAREILAKSPYISFTDCSHLMGPKACFGEKKAKLSKNLHSNFEILRQFCSSLGDVSSCLQGRS